MSLISVTLMEPLRPFTPLGINWGGTLATAILSLFTVVCGLIILLVSLVRLAAIAAFG